MAPTHSPVNASNANPLFPAGHPIRCTLDAACPQATVAIQGRFYITGGHAGFNSPANNAQGYQSDAKARAAIRHYSGPAPAASIVWTPDPNWQAQKRLIQAGKFPGPAYDECAHDFDPQTVVVDKSGLFVLCSRGCSALGQIVGEFKVVA